MDTANDNGLHIELKKKEDLRTLTHIVYGLYSVSFFLGITALIAIVLNYIKREEVRGTLYESHFIWQMRTFWWTLLWLSIGFVLTIVLIGFAVLFINTIWVIYRIAKGWLLLSEGKPAPVFMGS